MDPFPHNIKPMLATLVDQPFDRAGWTFEIKWDGYRAIAEINQKVKLYSRNLQPFNQKYQPVVKALQKIKHQVVLDGEIVVVDNQGRSHFQSLQNYAQTGDGQLNYFVFDLLYLNGYDLRSRPLLERKQLLQNLLSRYSLQSSLVQYSDHVIQKGKAFFRQAVKQGLEGIMAKDGQSFYEAGRRTLNWLKIKTHRRQEAVIAGFTQPRSSRKYFGALVLGVYDDHDQLIYVGHTGTGIDQKGLQYIYRRLQPLIQHRSPFAVTPKTNMPATWVKPKLVCEVEFTEWTEHGQMRHPSFQGLREDKKPQQVKREQEKAVSSVRLPTAP